MKNIKNSSKDKNETAYFGMGCFWGPDDFFSKLKGAIETTVGYSGGDKIDPNYHDLGDHTETIKIEFDPNIVSYKQLLGYFFKKHDPGFETKTQYRSVIFYINDEQKKEAQEALINYNKKYGKKALTKIEKLKKFYRAEEYHQKYFQKNNVKGIC